MRRTTKKISTASAIGSDLYDLDGRDNWMRGVRLEMVCYPEEAIVR